MSVPYEVSPECPAASELERQYTARLKLDT